RRLPWTPAFAGVTMERRLGLGSGAFAFGAAAGAAARRGGIDGRAVRAVAAELVLGAGRDLAELGGDGLKAWLLARLVAVEGGADVGKVARRGAAAAADDAGAGVAGEAGIDRHLLGRPVVLDLTLDVVGDAAVALGDDDVAGAEHAGHADEG